MIPTTETILEIYATLMIVFWIVFCLLAGGSILFCWVMFGIAWLKGWHDPNATPADILKRLTAPNREGSTNAPTK